MLAPRFRHAMPYLVDVTRKRTGDDRVMAARAVAAMAEPGDLKLELFAAVDRQPGDPVLELHGTTVLMRLGVPLPNPRAPRDGRAPEARGDSDGGGRAPGGGTPGGDDSGGSTIARPAAPAPPARRGSPRRARRLGAPRADAPASSDDNTP